jgi:hypothetical protein
METLAHLHMLKFYTDIIDLRAELADNATALTIA